MTLLWFFVWLIWDLVGDEEPLTFDPVNWWAGSLLFVIAVDLAGIHALQGRRQAVGGGSGRPRRGGTSSRRLEAAMARAGGFVDMNPTIPEDYAPIPEVELPDAASYRLLDFDAGAEFFERDAGRLHCRRSSREGGRRSRSRKASPSCALPGRAEDGERVLAARLAPRRPSRSRPLAQRWQAETGLVLGRRAALVARRRVMSSARGLTRREACAARPERCART